MTYPEALGYLNSFLNYEQTVQYRYPEDFSLRRVEELLRRLDDPHRAYPAVHVAGTKGKGSTCAFLASMLKAAGCRTGLYTSPHLLDFRERFRVDGTMITEAEMAAVVDRIRPLAGRELTYFEVTTACAFLWFKQRRVDAAVVEVGLGGRLDATNVLLPEVTILTPIGLDHLSKLGRTLGEIAREKAGILKPGVPAVVAPQQSEAEDRIRRAAGSVGAPLRWVEQEVQIQDVRLSPDGTRAAFQSPVRTYRDLTIPLLGRHQVANAAAALRAAELFSERHPEIRLESDVVRQGILRTDWPGRCQRLPGNPPILLDGAQTRESAQALRGTVQELFPGRRVCLIVGISTDKDLEGIAEVWGPWAGRIFLTQASVPRAEPVERLERVFRKFPAPCEKAVSVDAALRRARDTANPGDLLVVSGSLFVVAQMLESFPPPPAAQEQDGSDPSGKQGD